MSTKTTVSVVIPAYNAEEFIEDAVKSCFNQRYRPIEVVVVNDGSTDSTEDIVNNLSDFMPDGGLELRLLNVGENKGAANALNLGFSQSKGGYVCWLSADDVFTDREKTLKQVTGMERTRAQWSYFRDSYAGTSQSSAKLLKASYLPRLRILDQWFVRNAELRLMALLFRNPISGSSTMIRKECVESCGQFDPITRNVDGDGDLWMRYSALKLKLLVLKGAPVFYREHQSQTSKKKNLMIHGCELTRMRILSALERKGNLTKIIKKFSAYFPIVLRAKQHLKRPCTSEFLFNYILIHKDDFNRFFFRNIRKSLDEVRNHDNYLSIDRDKFSKDLELFMKSQVFQEFEEIFYKDDRL
jgi:glycosyltransferase involved in cell wall biosynthesis